MIFDAELDGLLDATKIHCLSYVDGPDIKTTHSYDEMRALLLGAKVLIGHNIVRYDTVVLERLLGIKIKARLIDTLPLSWYLNRSRRVHGLASFGLEYGRPKPPIDDWTGLTPEEYAHRCEEDVWVTKKLWGELKEHLLELYPNKEEADKLISYLTFKMDCAREQERSGWKLDVRRAQRAADSLLEAQIGKTSQLTLAMPPRSLYTDKVRPKKPFKKDGSLSAIGATWFALLKEEGYPEDYEGPVKVWVKEEEANPGSPEQVKAWLTSLGWVPETFKYVKDGDKERKIPQVQLPHGGGICPSILKLIKENPDVKLLEGLSVINHRLGLFKGFLKNHEDGWLKAEITGFTNTLRFKHTTIVNLPKVDKPWGEEVRGSLIAPEGYELCGSDMVSLEETTKKHYMFPYDPGFVKDMSSEGFDAHLDLAKFAGVVTQEQIDLYNKGELDLKATRSIYKAANYACVYGVGKYKLARETGLSVMKAGQLIETYWKRNWSVKTLSEKMVIKHVRGEMWLLNPVSGLYLPLRYKKDIFSTLNQSTGVYAFDSWVKEFRKKRSQLTGQMHDEIVACLKVGHRDAYSKILKDAIGVVNNKLKLNVDLDVDIQYGDNYASIH